MKRTLVVIALILFAGCMDVGGRDTELENHAGDMAKFADNCLLDVRDKQIPYGRSENCTKQLSRAAYAYTHSPGMKLTHINDEAIPRHAYIAESAKSVAWSAAALSNAKFRQIDPITSLW